MKSAFDLSRYHDAIAASARRLATTRRFEEPDQVPVWMGFLGSFYCFLLGFDIAEYFQDIDLQLEAQGRGQEWAFEELGDDRLGIELFFDIGPISEGLIFGADIARPEGTSPWSRHIIRDPSDIDRLPAFDPETNPGVHWFYRQDEVMRERAQSRGIPYRVSSSLGIHPPLSAACALAGPERIFTWMYEEPEMVLRLLDKLLETYFRLANYADRRAGRRRTSISLADDNSAFISAEMYRKMVMPYNRAIIARYGPEGCRLHADGPNDHLFKMYADEMHLAEMDIGGFSDIANAKRDMAGKTVIYGGLNCKDVYGDFETARPVIERSIAIGAPGGGYIFGVGGEAYAGVNPDTLVKTVAYAREISRK